METMKITIKRFIIIFFVIVLIFTFSGIFTLNSNAGTFGVIDSKTLQLMNENDKLKKEYDSLIEKLNEIEREMKRRKEVDNLIYTQILGVDFDTTDYYKYETNIDLESQPLDTVFSKVTNRAMYAAKMLSSELNKLEETSHRFKNNKNAILYYPTISPIKTKDFIHLSSPYGWREHPTKKQTIFHEGVDISAHPGTEVYSTAQGRVVKIMYSKYGYGNRIVIKHAYGFETLYAHLGIIDVKKGQWVNKNQKIGTVGNTGLSTGPHLHYEIKKYNEPRDPLGYFYTHLTEEYLAMN